jgi:hypothetical protein
MPSDNKGIKMKMRSILITAEVFLGIIFFSPLMGRGNLSTAISAETGPTKLYMPIVLRNYDPQTVFGAEVDKSIFSVGLDKMAATNISWVRYDALAWSSVESIPGERNWAILAGLESALQDASSRGIQTILVVNSTPAWAQKIAGSSCGPIAPNQLTAFASFMHDLVARYSRSPYKIKYWEIWNEPDVDPSQVSSDSVFGCWGDQSDVYFGGGYYAEMLKAVYPQIKAADLQAQVVIGGLLLDCNPATGGGCTSTEKNSLPLKFLEGILRNNGGPYFDGIGYHAYDYYDGQSGTYSNPNWQSAWNTTGPVLIAKAHFIQSVLSQYGGTGKFLMNTESAILCDTCNNDPVFEISKANYLVQNYAAAIAEGLRANIWYSALGWRNSGLLDLSLIGRPAYTAMQFSRNEIGRAMWVRNIIEYSGVKGYEFHRGDRRIWVLWSLNRNPNVITLPGVPLAVWDALGNSISPSISLNVDPYIRYLEWNP